MSQLKSDKINGTNHLVRTNQFATAAYTLPPDAHRILSVAISMIRLNDEKFHTFRIYTKHLVTFFPALKSDKNAISRIDTATDALMGSYVKIKKNTGWLKRNLIHSCQFSRNDGHPYVNIRLVDDMLPFLVGISG